VSQALAGGSAARADGGASASPSAATATASASLDDDVALSTVVWDGADKIW